MNAEYLYEYAMSVMYIAFEVFVTLKYFVLVEVRSPIFINNICIESDHVRKQYE